MYKVNKFYLKKTAFLVQLLVVFMIVIYCFFITGCKSDTDEEGEKVMISSKNGKERMNDGRRLLIMDTIHRKKLQEIQYWIIKEGVSEFYRTRDVSHIVEYIKSTGYGLVLGPSIDEYHTHEGKKIHTLVRVIIQEKYLMNQLWCLAQNEYKGNIYEYWVIQEKSQGRSYKRSLRNCVFIITKANSLKGSREVIHSSEQFYNKYKVESDFTFSFPLAKVHKLRVHYYPDSFQETEMEAIKKILKKLK